MRPDSKEMVTDVVPRRSGDRVTMHNVRLVMIVLYAYDIWDKIGRLAADKSLLNEDIWYDIDAKTPPGEFDAAAIRRMFQALLAERFQFQAHWETRDLQGFDLVIAKGGPKIKPSDPNRRIVIDGNVFPSGTGQLYRDRAGDGHLVGKASSLDKLVTQLSGRMQAPVRDRTGLSGLFDYDVRFELNSMKADPDTAPLVTTAIQDELWLRLEKAKIQAEVLVVDRFGKLTPN